MKSPASKFLAGFRLDELLRSTSCEEIDFSGPGGGMGATACGISHDGLVDLRHGSSTTFSIKKEQAFDENGLLAVLMARLAAHIEESEAEISGVDGSSVNEFLIEYTEAKLKGRIRISLSRRGKYYHLDANARERSVATTTH